MKKLILCIVAILVLLSIFFVIRPSSKIDHRLLLADELLREYPDSVFALLDTLDSKSFTGENKALFALLVTQAKFKMRNPDPSDSLINIALHYYIYSSDSLRKAQTYLYKGRIDELIGKKKEALSNYQRASETAIPTNNYNLLMLIYNKWALLLADQSLYEEAIKKQKQALQYAVIDNDTTSQILISREIGSNYYLNRNLDSTIYYYNKALRLALLTKYEDQISALYNLLAIYYRNTGKYDLAMSYANKSIPMATKKNIAGRYSVKGNLFMLTGNYDSAKYYLSEALKNNNIYSKAANHLLMGKLESKFGNFEEAYQYCNQYVEYADTIRREEGKEEIAELQKRYDFTLIENENHRLKISKQQLQITLLAACLLIFITISFLLFYIPKKHRELREMKKAKNDFINQSMLEVKSKTIELQKVQEEIQIRECDRQLHLSQKEEELKLRRKKERELKTIILKMDTIVHKINALQSLTTIQRIKAADMRLTTDELCNLEEVLEVCYNNFASRLRKEFPKLKDDDIYLCCLLKMRVENCDIISLLDTNQPALRKRKYRMKHDKMELAEEVDLDKFLSDY